MSIVGLILRRGRGLAMNIQLMVRKRRIYTETLWIFKDIIICERFFFEHRKINSLTQENASPQKISKPPSVEMTKVEMLP